jgi:hypothetical protein
MASKKQRGSGVNQHRWHGIMAKNGVWRGENISVWRKMAASAGGVAKAWRIIETRQRRKTMASKRKRQQPSKSKYQRNNIALANAWHGEKA